VRENMGLAWTDFDYWVRGVGLESFKGK